MKMSVSQRGLSPAITSVCTKSKRGRERIGEKRESWIKRTRE